MDLYQQNDSGIIVSNTPPQNPNSSYTQATPALGNLKPPKTPSRLYSRDRSNHSMSMAYSTSNRKNSRVQEELNDSLNHSNNQQHLSRRNSSAAHNLSIQDSDAQSLPQGTFAIKAGPQTVMSQWVITLDDDEDEEEEEDDEDENNNVEVCDDINNDNPNYPQGLTALQNHIPTNNNQNNTVLSDQEEKWEDALASRLDLLSTSSVNNRNASLKSPNPIKQILKQQQQNKLNESNISHSNSLRQTNNNNNSNSGSKYLQHSLSDNLVNYELNLNDLQAQKQQQRTIHHQNDNTNKFSPNNLSLQSPPNKKSSTPSSTASLPSPPQLPVSQPPSLNNSLDPFQTLLNQILSDSNGQNKQSNSETNFRSSTHNVSFTNLNNLTSISWDRQFKLLFVHFLIDSRIETICQY